MRCKRLARVLSDSFGKSVGVNKDNIIVFVVMPKSVGFRYSGKISRTIVFAFIYQMLGTTYLYNIEDTKRNGFVNWPCCLHTSGADVGLAKES